MIDLLKQDAEELSNKIDLKELDGKSILITGASGLLGINLISLLKYSGIDFQCTALFNSQPEKHFLKLHDPRFTYWMHDLAEVDFSKIEDRFDVIFHFATYGQPNKMFSKSPTFEMTIVQLNTIKLNTQVVMNLFKLLKTNGKFIFMSTSELYNGLSGKHKESEIGTTTTEHDRACYIESKRCGEAICNVYKNQGYDVKIIRLCLGYGIGVKITDKRALNNFVFNALTDNKINLLDSGDAIRTYCYVSDVLEMIINIMLHGKELIYNVGGEEIITIKQLADKIGEILNIPVSVPSVENKACGATSGVSLDMSRYMNEFGQKDFICIEDGLKKTIEWFRKLLQ